MLEGTKIAEFQLSGVEAIKRWFLSFGQHAEVLEPARLRAEMQEEVRALSLMYREARKVP